MSTAAKITLKRNPHFTAAGLRSAQSPGQQKVEPHRRAALDWRADFWQHARQVRCGGVRRKVRGPGSNPRPLRLLPPLLLLTSGVRVEAAASTRSCFSNPRDPAYLSNPGSLALEPTAQRIRRLTGPRRQSLRRLGLEPVILPHLRRRALWRPWQHHGAPASNPCDVPPSNPTISYSTHSLCCRYLRSPYIPSTPSAATSTPPPQTHASHRPRVPPQHPKVTKSAALLLAGLPPVRLRFEPLLPA